MPSALDRRFDEELARVIGPGGRLVIGRDDLGRAIVENLPATLPQFFRTFCALNADHEALVAGAERFTFADLDALSERVARGFAARGITKGDRVGIAMRNCPSSVLAYMGLLKAGAVATLLNGWWEPAEMEHAIRLTEPKLIIADAARA
jgi:acyl-CoA synthetase (AMP-forming)/AMP-acid ligase II